ncbi:uncharacterized protein LOC121412531 [Lytechinus variegatus]|uniref:uncharacterized protein LOC121412531 n=1 Tax=Lytechinus variegatus TaxID=7654 RepID=UPI001BB1FB13|nr:uncharacterized protein LOC121412531 [Lytechinus variegatus]
MGRKPKSQESTDWEQVGEEAMLEALDSALLAVLDGRMQKQDYYFKFCTADSNEYAGSCERRSSRSRKLSKEMLEMVKLAFEAVGSGSLKEEGYYFELTTPYFQYKSGCYPPHQNDQTTCFKDPLGPESCRISDYSLPVGSQIRNFVNDPLPYQLTWKRKPNRPMNGITITLSTSWFSIRLFLVISVMMVHATPSSAMEEPPLTLTAGQSGVIPFGCKNRQPSAPKYYTVKFEDKDRPFYIDGLFDTEGLMSPNQAGRFNVEYVENDSEMSIQINIASVSVEDQGTYVAILIVHGNTLESHTMKRAVFIFIPPGPAICFIGPSETLLTRYTIHCHSRRGNGNPTLSCFQKGDKIPFFYNNAGEEGDSQVVLRRNFWFMDIDSPVFCCSHDQSDTITQSLCNQYRFPYKYPEISTTPKPPKITTEIALIISSISKPDKNIPYPSYSGCDRNSNQSALIISLAVLFTYACISNP